MDTREWSFPVMLTCVTGRLLCPIEEVYQILSHVLGYEVYTHQIPSALAESRPWILQHYPALATISCDPLDAFLGYYGSDVGVQKFLAQMHAAQGSPASYALVPIPREANWHPPDPVQDLVGMIGEDRVIAVVAPPAP